MDAVSDEICEAVHNAYRHGYSDALLKEQEAESVIDIADAIDGIEVGRCPSCDKGIVNKKSDPTRYCRFCGQAVKWE